MYQYGGKIDASQLIGEPRRLKNGAMAGHFPNPMGGKPIWRIFKGAAVGSSSPRKVISQEAAQRAFNAYWENKIKAAKTPTQSRSLKAAWARDINYTRPKGIRQTTSYLRNPGRLEFEGVDTGIKRFKAPSAKQLANLAYGRSVRSAGRPTKPAAPKLIEDECMQYRGKEECASNPQCGWTQGKGKRAGSCSKWQTAGGVKSLDKAIADIRQQMMMAPRSNYPGLLAKHNELVEQRSALIEGSPEKYKTSVWDAPQIGGAGKGMSQYAKKMSREQYDLKNMDLVDKISKVNQKLGTVSTNSAEYSKLVDQLKQLNAKSQALFNANPEYRADIWGLEDTWQSGGAGKGMSQYAKKMSREQYDFKNMDLVDKISKVNQKLGAVSTNSAEYSKLVDQLNQLNAKSQALINANPGYRAVDFGTTEYVG